VYGDYTRLQVPLSDEVVHYIVVNLFSPVEVKPETVGQYTGLKDKNWKNIYKGDILYHNGSGDCSVHSHPYGMPSKSFKDQRVVVECIDGMNIARHVDGYKPNLATSQVVKGWKIIQPYELWNYQRWFEIIGNIHDNPELLEV
jgi:uncharacterized phage protein (TIGR01671 family)